MDSSCLDEEQIILKVSANLRLDSEFSKDEALRYQKEHIWQGQKAAGWLQLELLIEVVDCWN